LQTNDRENVLIARSNRETLGNTEIFWESTMDAAFDGLKFEIQEESHTPTRIKVIGIGGAGSNAVSRIAEYGPAGAEYYILNTDHRALDASTVQHKHLLGAKTTGGRGTGANPAVGRQAALDDTEAILEILEGADLVILAAGLGGGTGTGAAPVIASLAREMNALTIGVVTKPFSFEGPRKMEIAEKGLEELAQVLDNVLIVPNDRLLDIAPRGTSFKDALRMVDDVLAQTVNGIGDIVLRPGIINRDFSDVKATLSGMGTVRLGSATAKGAEGVVEAARKAIECPMLDAHGIAGARVVLLHVMGNQQLQLHDVFDATEFIRKAANNPDLHVNLGLSLDESLADRVQVTVIATSFDEALAGAPPIAAPVRVATAPIMEAPASPARSSVPVVSASTPLASNEMTRPIVAPVAAPAATAPRNLASVTSAAAMPAPATPPVASVRTAPVALDARVALPVPQPVRPEPASFVAPSSVAPVPAPATILQTAPVAVTSPAPAEEPAAWSAELSMEDTREVPTAEALAQEPELDYRFTAPGLYDHLQAAPEVQPSGLAPLFHEPPTAVQVPDDADGGLFDLDDLDTPAYLRQGAAPRR
jgi:cell division protein FtsZ